MRSLWFTDAVIDRCMLVGWPLITESLSVSTAMATGKPLSSIKLIADRGLPVAIAVLTDKLSVIKGQPTSIHLSMTASVNHRDLMADLRDRNVTTVNDEQTPDLV